MPSRKMSVSSHIAASLLESVVTKTDDTWYPTLHLRSVVPIINRQLRHDHSSWKRRYGVVRCQELVLPL